jgi:acylphosphatase
MATERRRVRYSGRVQGVGFRFTSQRLAQGFAVNGYVRNLPDGRVELVAEGEPGVLDAFLAAVRSEMGGKIHSEHSDPEPVTPPRFDDFSIRY